MKNWQAAGLISTSAAAIFAAVMGVAYAGQRMAAHDEPQIVTPAAVTSSSPLPAGVRINWSGSGTLTVPGQIAPGQYLVRADDGALGCLWQRLKRIDGRPDSIIDQGQITRGGYATPVIAPSDRFFKLGGGCVWTKL